MIERVTGLSDTAKGLLAALVVVICWSGFNIVSRFGSTASFTPFDLAALRYGVSGALTLPFFLKYVLLREWPRAGPGPEKNEMYSLQWFSLAALAVVLAVVLSFRKIEK